MPVDPYQNCPCDSGKKFKWCCQRLAKYVEKAEQLLEKDQLAAALQALDEGLAVDSSNLWLRTMKAQLLLGVHDHDAAYPLIDEILASKPGYRPALLLRLQDEMAHGAATEAVTTLQEVLVATPANEADETLGWMCLVGRSLAELGYAFAALQHLRFVARRDTWKAELERDIGSLEGMPDLAPWLKDSWELRPAPHADDAVDQRWREATESAAAGRWSKAAAIFDSLAADQPNNATVWFNLGICQAWAAQNESAATALHRAAEREADAELALHLESLGECLDPRDSAQSVDVVRVCYPMRDPTRLIQRLKEHPRLQVHRLDAASEDVDKDVKDEFYLLDKDSLKDVDTPTLENLPLIIGIVRTRGQALELEFTDPAADDPRPGLVLEVAGDTVDPNGQRAVAGTLPVSTFQLRRMWGVPSGARPETIHQIRRIVHQNLYREVWPDIPLGWLGNKTPREASQIPGLKRTLRAAVLLVEYSTEVAQFDLDLDELRGQLSLDREPTLEGDQLDIERLPLGRLRQVRAESLSTPQLCVLFDRAMRFSLPLAVQQAAATLVARPTDHAQFDHTAAFKVLIDFASARQDRAAALDWIQRARRFESETGGQPDRPTWEFSEWQLSLRFDPPEAWAPRLNELMQKYGQNKEASSEIMMILLRAGLTRLVPHPQDPNKVMLDARLLEQILARYGTRQAGMLDLSPIGGQAGKIWTPDAGAGRSPIVLPGQESAAPTRSKLVIPGS